MESSSLVTRRFGDLISRETGLHVLHTKVFGFAKTDEPSAAKASPSGERGTARLGIKTMARGNSLFFCLHTFLKYTNKPPNWNVIRLSDLNGWKLVDNWKKNW